MVFGHFEEGKVNVTHSKTEYKSSKARLVTVTARRQDDKKDDDDDNDNDDDDNNNNNTHTQTQCL